MKKLTIVAAALAAMVSAGIAVAHGIDGAQSVAAVNASGGVAGFSSDNLSVEVAAPGVNISAQGRDGGYWLVTGTSPACALVACGGTETQDGGADAKADGVAADAFLGVAAVAYCCFDAMAVADVAFVVDATDGDAPDGD